MRHPLAPVLALCAALSGFGAAGPAVAQMVLPGAVEPTPEGAPVAPPSNATPRKKPRGAAAADGGEHMPASAPAKVPGLTTLGGQTFFRNGRKGAVSFEFRDKLLNVVHLSLAGEKSGNSQEECAIEIADLPLSVTDLGQPNGLSRIALTLPACPMTFDVLDGALLGLGAPPVCTFKSADCTVHTDGLWGPQPGTIGPDKVKSIERARTQADTSMRANFKRLLALTKDRPTITTYAREQAGFSSSREEICRNYAGESRHGYCATRLTEARAATLRAKGEIAASTKALRKKTHNVRS